MQTINFTPTLLALKELKYWFKPRTHFEFNGQQIPYFDHEYNHTKYNERSIEVPIIQSFLKQAKSSLTLEIGNVLAHYQTVRHDVLDKYETAKGVINEDVIHFKPKKKYELIVAISTFEHVGWDGYPRDPEKCKVAIDHLYSLLKTGGRLVFTVPLGYNHDLDTLLRARAIGLTSQYFMQRVSGKNHWIQTNSSVLEGAKYNYPYPNANEIMVGEIVKS